MFLAIEYKTNEYLLAFTPEGELKDELEGCERTTFPVVVVVFIMHLAEHRFNTDVHVRLA